MEDFLVSTAAVAMAEIGDKTQLLALLLAMKWRQPLQIMIGIVIATLANHALAGLLGGAIAAWLDGPWLRYALAGGFFAMALWTLKPDRADGLRADEPRHGVVLATAAAFFVVEMGDKTQIATAALAAHRAVVPVVMGSTLGMILANAPCLFFGDVVCRRLPLRAIRWGAAAIFAAIAVAIALDTATA